MKIIGVPKVKGKALICQSQRKFSLLIENLSPSWKPRILTINVASAGTLKVKLMIMWVIGRKVNTELENNWHRQWIRYEALTHGLKNWLWPSSKFFRHFL